jgi:hypothetical protein
LWRGGDGEEDALNAYTYDNAAYSIGGLLGIDYANRTDLSSAAAFAWALTTPPGVKNLCCQYEFQGGLYVGGGWTDAFGGAAARLARDPASWPDRGAIVSFDPDLGVSWSAAATLQDGDRLLTKKRFKQMIQALPSIPVASLVPV